MSDSTNIQYECYSCSEKDDEIERLRAALEEISEGKGRYSKDPLTHASNTIEDMIEIAREALRDD